MVGLQALQAPRAKRRRRPNRLLHLYHHRMIHHRWRHPPHPPPAGPPPPPHVLPPIEDPPSDDDGIIGGGAAEPPQPHGEEPEEEEDRGNEKPDWKDGLDGSQVAFQWYKPKSKALAYANWKLKCCRHDHPAGCEKKMNHTEASTRRFGHLGPLAFLHAWIPLEPRPGQTHARRSPGHVEVGAYLEAHRDALEAIYQNLYHDRPAHM